MLFLLALLSLISISGQNAAPTLRPFADYQDTGYVVLSALDGHGADDLKRDIAADRILYLALPKAKDGFWTRDAMPVPSWDSPWSDSTRAPCPGRGAAPSIASR